MARDERTPRMAVHEEGHAGTSSWGRAGAGVLVGEYTGQPPSPVSAKCRLRHRLRRGHVVGGGNGEAAINRALMRCR